MAVAKRGKYWFGDTQADIRAELTRYGRGNYPVHHFADAVCECGHRQFFLIMDDTQGAAVRICEACEKEHPIGDSAEYLEEAELKACSCLCGEDVFEITAGVSLYDKSEDVRWFYVGCRCPSCGLVGCYGDWKNEFIGYRKLLSRV